MDNLEYHEHLNAEPEKLQELLGTPRLCMLLNPTLELQKQRGIAREHFIVPVEYQGETHNAVILGFYRHSHNAEVEADQREKWEELGEDAADAYPINTELIESPQLCMLLNPKLTTAQLEQQGEIFHVVQIQHEGESRHATLCAYYQLPLEVRVTARIRESVPVTMEKQSPEAQEEN